MIIKIIIIAAVSAAICIGMVVMGKICDDRKRTESK